MVRRIVSSILLPGLRDAQAGECVGTLVLASAAAPRLDIGTADVSLRRNALT